MKKIILILTVLTICLSLVSFSQDKTKIPLKQIQGWPTAVTASEIGRLDDVRDTIQKQLDSKFDKDSAVVYSTLFYTKKEVQNLKINNQLVAGLQWYGSPIKALPYGVALPHLFSSNSTMVDGTLWDMFVQIDDTMTITGVGYVQHTQGAYTSDQYNGFAIYSTASGIDTKGVETVNDGNLWKAAAGKVEKAFASPQVLLPGNYKVCAVWNASATTTAPIVYTHTGVSANITYLLPNSQKISGTVVTQNSMPATITNSGLTTQSNYLGIYLY